jgi:hypothetical protein
MLLRLLSNAASRSPDGSLEGQDERASNAFDKCGRFQLRDGFAEQEPAKPKLECFRVERNPSVKAGDINVDDEGSWHGAIVLPPSFVFSHRAVAKPLTHDEARRIAANSAKPPSVRH